MDYGLIAVIALWSLILFSVILHYFKGYKRGTKKSLYYFAVNLLTIITALAIFTLVSVSLFFTPESFIDLLNSFRIDTTQYQDILLDPEIAPIVFSVIDLVLKLALFFILYPIIKLILTLVLFKPIYSIATMRNDKTIKPTSNSRLLGGLLGGMKGLISSVVYILPIIVLIGVLNPAIETIIEYEPGNSTISHSNGLNGNNNNTSDMLDDYIPYLESVKTFNDLGPYSLVKNIPFGNKPMIDQLFDMVFYVSIKTPDGDVVPVSLASEINGLGEVFASAYVNGYISRDFDYKTISKEDLPTIRVVFDYLSNSHLISGLIPIGANYAINNYSDQILEGYDVKLRPYSTLAINEFLNINWHGEDGEFNRLYNVFESVLDLGSVGDWLSLMEIEDFSTFDLTKEESIKLGTIIRNVGQLELLLLANVGIDYLTTLPDLQNNFTYIDEIDREEYIQQNLITILENPRYFLTNHFDVIANTIELAFSNDQVDMIELVNNISDPNYILSTVYADHLADIVNEATQFGLLLDLIPLAVDYGLFGVLELDRDNPEIGILNDKIGEINWSSSIENITGIYSEVAKLGLAPFIGDNVNFGLIIDHLAENHMGSIRVILNRVLTTEPVEIILNDASPMLVDKYFIPTTEDEEAIKDFILNDLLAKDQDGNLYFSVGQEISSLLTILEGVYQVTNFEDANRFVEDIMNLFVGQDDIDIKTIERAYVKIMELLVKLDNFNRLDASDLEYEEFSNALRNLQILEIGQDFIIEFVMNNYGQDFDFDINDLGDVKIADEIVDVLDLVKALGSYHSPVSFRNYTRVDLSSFIDTELKDYLLNSSPFIKNAISYQINNLDQLMPEITEYLIIPDLGDFDSIEWQTEVDHLLNIIFDINYVLFMESSKGEETVLSFRFIADSIEEYEKISLDEVFRFTDPRLASRLVSSLSNSKIISGSIMSFVDNFELEGITINWPETLKSNTNPELLNANALGKLISDFVYFIEDYNNLTFELKTLGDVLSINLDNVSYSQLVNAYYDMNVSTVERLAYNATLNEIFNDLLLNENIHDKLYDALNSAVTDLTIEEGIFENLGLGSTEFGDLLKLIYDLEVPTSLFSMDSGIDLDAVIYYLTNTLSEVELNQILTYPILHQVITNIIIHDEVKNYLVDMIEPLINNSLPAAFSSLEIDVLSYIELFTSFRKNYQYNDHLILNLFDMDEVLTLFKSYKALELNSINDLNNLDLRILNQLKTNKLDGYNNNLEVITESRLLRVMLAKLVTDGDVLEFGASYINNLLENYKLSLRISSDDLYLGNPFIVGDGTYQLFSQDVLVELLETVIALNVDGILKGNITPYDLVVSLNNRAFNVLSGDNRTAVDVIYDLTFVKDGLDYIVRNKEMSNDIIDFANDFIIRYVNYIHKDIVVNYLLTTRDVTITEEMVSKDNIVVIVESFKQFDKTSINNFTNIRTLEDIYNALNLSVSKEPLLNILQTPLFMEPITRVIDHNLWSDTLSQAVNIMISRYTSNVSLSKELFKLDYNSNEELMEDLLDLIVSGYATGFDLGVSLSPQLVKDLETKTLVYNNVEQIRLDQIFSSRIIVNYLDKILRSDEIITQGVEVLNNQLHKYLGMYNIDLDFEITREMFEPSQYAMLNGMINPDEYKTAIRAFNKLNLNSFGELSNFRNINFIHDKVRNTQFIDTLFESKWLHHGLSDVVTSRLLQNGLARLIDSQANSRFGVTTNIDPLAFDFTDNKYGLFTTDNDNNKLVSVAVIKDTLTLATSTNWLNIVSTNPNTLTNNLLLPNRLGDDHITQISSNKVVIALFDRVLNPNNNEHNFSNAYRDVINVLLNRFNLGNMQVGSLNGLFNYSNDLLDQNNVLDSYELVRIVNGLSLVDLSNPTQFKISRVSSLINSDLNGNTLNDFEELFASKLLNHYMVTVARSEKLYRKVAEIIEGRIDFNVNVPVYDLIFPEQLITNNTIQIDELKKLVTALSVVEESTSGFANLSPNVLIDIVGQNEVAGVDDLDRVLESEYIVYVIGNILNNDGLNKVLNRMVKKVLGVESNLDITIPSYLIHDNGNTDLSHGRLSRANLRQLMVSANLLLNGVEINSDALKLSLLLDAIDRDINGNGIDDFDEINDGYLHFIIATLFDSDAIKKVMSDSAGLDIADLVFSPAMYDENNVMSKAEVKQIFLGLQVLGITDFDDLGSGLGEDMLNSLDQTQVDVLLDSSFLYRIIDLTIKEQVSLPDDVFNVAGDYIGYVSRDEIGKLVEALGIVGGDLNLDVTTFRVSDLIELYDLNSVIIDSFISKELLDKYPDSLHQDAYRNIEQTILTRDELSYMMTTLTILVGVNGLITDLDNLDLDNITTEDLSDIINLESYLVTRILSKEISTNILDINAIPEDSFTDNTKLDLKQSELLSIVEAINILGGDIGELNNIDSSKITSNTLEDLLLLESPLIEYQIQDAVKVALNNDLPSTAVDGNGNILRYELDQLVLVIRYLGDDLDQMSNLDPSDIDSLLLTNLLSTDSRIVDYQISNVILDTTDPSDIPNEAIDGDGNITRDELFTIRDVLSLLGSVEEINNLDPENITVGLLRSLLLTNSHIVERQISNAIINTMDEEDIPSTVLLDGNIIRTELLNLTYALEALVDNIGELNALDASDITSTKLAEALNAESKIVERKISTTVKTTFDDENDIPLQAIDLATGDISRDELDNLVDALGVLNKPASELQTIDTATIDSQLLKDLLDSGSHVIERHIAMAIDGSMDNLPQAAYLDGYIKTSELRALVGALTIMGGSVDSMDSLDAEDIDTHFLTDLLQLDSRIIDYQISKAVITSLSDIPIGAIDGEGNITRDELIKLNGAIAILGGNLEGINSLDANTLHPSVLESLTDLNSLIIDRQLSNTIKLVLGSKVPSHVTDNDLQITSTELKKLSQAVLGLNLLSIGSIDTLDKDTITATQITSIISSDSGIALKIVSDAIIDSGIANPDSLYNISSVKHGEVKVLEMIALANVIDLLDKPISEVGNVKYIDLATLDDEDIDEIFAPEATIMYYLISDQLKTLDDASMNTLFDITDFVDSNRNNHLTRDAVTTFIKQ